MMNHLDRSARRPANRSFFDDFDELFERSLAGYRPLAARDAFFEPSVDVEESKSAFLISIDVPGLRREDVRIDVNDNLLTISGERKREQNSEEGGMRRFERSHGKFQRSFSLPATADCAKVEAHLENGVLTVAIPKAETAKPRSIEIQNGKSGFFSKLVGADKKAEKTDETH